MTDLYRDLESFLIKGESSDDKEKSGRLSLLTADLKDSLLDIQLNHVGIVALRPVVTDGKQALQLEAELYVERIELSGGK